MIADVVASQSTDILAFVRAIHEPGSVIEIRSLNCVDRQGGSFRSTVAGWFDNPELAAEAIRTLELRKPPAIYATLNSVNPDLLARSANRVQPNVRYTTSDADIMRRRWLMIDIDPVRPAGISSTDDESAHATELADSIYLALADLGWPEPIKGMSGNGRYLHYRIDLPNDDESRDQVRALLRALADRFDNDSATVDCSTFNAARIAKVLGTWARKGDSIEKRPHRQSWHIIPNEPIAVVSLDQLREVASWVAKPEPTLQCAKRARELLPHDSLLRRASNYIDKMPPSIAGQGGHNAAFRTACVLVRGFMLSKSQALILMNRFNDRCDPRWSAKEIEHKVESATKALGPMGYLRDLTEPEWSGFALPDHQSTTREPLSPISVRDLIRLHPTDDPALIEGLIRIRETMNIIAHSKAKKTFLAIGLSYAIASGREWMGRQCTRGRVLVLDCELRPAELRRRYQTVAHFLVDDESIDMVDVVSLRGCGKSIIELIHDIRVDIRKGQYIAIVWDALYRLLPDGVSENDNAQMMTIYNALDSCSEHSGASQIVIHHTSKGSQSDKSITDVGAGAGSISRAADTHLVLRPHELADCMVLEAVCRSYPSPDPLTMRWEYPLWHPSHIEPEIKQPKGGREKAQEKTDSETLASLTKALGNVWRSESDLRKATGFGAARVTRGLSLLKAQSKKVKSKKTGKRIEVYAMPKEVST